MQEKALLALALVFTALACGRDTSEVVFVDRADAGSYELRGETRKALAASLSREIELDVAVPEDPVLVFAIGAFTEDRPTLLAPVRFRVLVDDGESETAVFEETLRRSQGERWFSQSVDLASWSGRSVTVVFEARRGEGGIAGAEEQIVALWGNPILKSRSAASEKPALILVSIDCLRADHVGSYGYPRDTTPSLDAFAREAVLFRNAVATSSYTLPTHASMLTGLPPSLHGAMAHRIRSSVELLPELLAREGYQALGVVSAPFLAGAYGFDRGFHVYRLSSDRAEGLVDQAIALLDEAEGSSRFLFLHLFDVHWPYSPPGEFIERFGPRPEDVTDLLERVEKRTPPEDESEIEQLRNLYDAEIAYVDAQLGRFFDELRAREMFDSSLVIVTADHGEAFYEHGYWEHARPWWDDGPGLYEEIVHVPLLVKWPNTSDAAEVERVVSQTDIFATFLEAAGLPHERPWSVSLRRGGSGRALSEFIASPRDRESTLEAALRQTTMKYWASYRAGSVDELYRSPAVAEVLYDLETDLSESRNLAPSGHEAIDDYRDTLRRYLDAALEARGESADEDVTLDRELLEKLKALGYVAQ